MILGESIYGNKVPIGENEEPDIPEIDFTLLLNHWSLNYLQRVSLEEIYLKIIELALICVLIDFCNHSINSLSF